VAGDTVITKVGNWKEAYDAILSELSPPELDEAYGLLVATKVVGENSGILELDMQAYAARVNAAMAMARLTAANRRAAATVAALLVATGIKPAAIDYGDDIQ
jgi:hypothetical protein